MKLNKLKKLLSAAIAAAMVLGTITIPAFADEMETAETIDEITAVTDADEAAVTETVKAVPGRGGGSIAEKSEKSEKSDNAAAAFSLSGEDETVSMSDSEQVTVTTEDKFKEEVKDGANIVLGNDITLTDHTNGILIYNDWTVTIDLGGHTLYGGEDTYAIRATNGSTLTVKNGTIDVGCVDSGYLGWSFGIDNRGGTVTVENVGFTTDAGSEETAGDAIAVNWDRDYVDEYGNFTGDYGTTTLNSVTVAENLWIDVYNASGNTLNINGGTYNNYQMFNNYGVINITDGTFNCEILAAGGGQVNISDGTFNWYVGATYLVEDEGGIVNISGGAFKNFVRADEYATLNISGGDFSDKGCTLQNYGTMNVTANISVQYLETTTDINWDYITCDYLVLTGEITEGEYTVSELSAVQIPANSTAVIHLKDGRISKPSNETTEIRGGSFDGTVSYVESTPPVLFGGTYTEELKNSIDATNNLFGAYVFSMGYGWIDNQDGTYSVGEVGTVSLNAQANNSAAGKISSISWNAGSLTHGGPTANFSGITLSKGGHVIISATAALLEDEGVSDYKFKGWYTDSEGKGDCLSSGLALNKRFEVTEDITLYAVFEAKAEYQALVDLVNAWLYESGTTLKDSYKIESVNDMFCFSYAVNEKGVDFSGKTVTLAADLDYTSSEVEFRPIGTDTHIFEGTFDGGGHTISGITLERDYSYMGIFGYNKGTIKNLNVKDCVFKTSYDVGGIAAWSEGTIENCSVTGCTISGDYRYAGGIVGHTFGITMTNVTSKDNKIIGWKSGGIVGYADGLKLSGAVSSGNVKDEDTDVHAMVYGAVVGHLNAGESTMTDLTVDATGVPLIATNYSVSTASLVINGDNTQITAANIIPSNTSSKTIQVQGGNYTLDGIISEGGKGTGLTLTGGDYTTEVEKFVAEGYVWKQRSDGIYIVRKTLAEILNTASTLTSTITLDKESFIDTLVKSDKLDTNIDVTYKVVADSATEEGKKAIADVLAGSGADTDNMKVDIADIRVLMVNGDAETDVTSEVNDYLGTYNDVNSITLTYTLPVAPKDGTVQVYHYTGGVANKVDDKDIEVSGRDVKITAISFSDWAVCYEADETDLSVTENIGVSFEYESDGVYNIMLRPQETDGNYLIYRFMSADLTFELTGDEKDTLVYEIEPAASVNITTPAENRYEFNLDGINEDSVTASEIKLGQVKFGGYGVGKFSVAAVETNVVNTAVYGTVDDNIVAHYTAGGEKKLVLNDDVTQKEGVIDPIIMKPATKVLTVNVEFPNNIKDNDAEYQNMQAVISGGDLTDDYTIEFGTDTDTKLADNIYTFTKELTKNITYTVTVSGAGYRTAHYSVNMSENKTLNFWNNVKDDPQVIEVGKETGAVTKNFLAGDIVKDNTINIYDLSAVVSYFGTEGLTAENYPGYAKYDLNRDGVIDSKDVAYVLVSWGE